MRIMIISCRKLSYWILSQAAHDLLFSSTEQPYGPAILITRETAKLVLFSHNIQFPFIPQYKICCSLLALRSVFPFQDPRASTFLYFFICFQPEQYLSQFFCTLQNFSLTSQRRHCLRIYWSIHYHCFRKFVTVPGVQRHV